MDGREHKEAGSLKEIVVYITNDYSKNESFHVDAKCTKEEITEMVNDKFGPEGWWYYDIW